MVARVTGRALVVRVRDVTPALENDLRELLDLHRARYQVTALDADTLAPAEVSQ